MRFGEGKLYAMNEELSFLVYCGPKHEGISLFLVKQNRQKKGVCDATQSTEYSSTHEAYLLYTA